MFDIVQSLSRIGLVPVIKIEDPEQAVPLAKALCEGGLPCAEITFRTAQAAEAIRRITEAFPEMIVGAGTVLTTEQVDAAVEAGSAFIVSPGLNPRIVSYCLSKNIPVVPGTSSPSDMEQALELGLDTVKFFPAEASGGLKAIKAMAAPYTTLSFMPTGGINASNVTEYLSFPRILCCGGSWMVPDSLLKAADFEGIRKLTEQAVLAMLDLKLDPTAETPRVKTLNVARAMRYLATKGYVFEEEKASKDAKGQIVEVPFCAPFDGVLTSLS